MRGLVGSVCLVVAAITAGCASTTPVVSSDSTTSVPAATTSVVVPPAGSLGPDTTAVPIPPSGVPTTAPTGAPLSEADVRALVSPLRIDDRPRTDGYRRDEWPHWKDIDGDGCDGREQALRDASTVAATVGAGCEIEAGAWTSAYDGLTTTDPSTFDVDHVVPLQNAHQSGGWEWSTDRRAQFANDPQELWVVSAASNRAKGASAPDQWRPPNRAVWCEYATRWLAVKLRWSLTATTSERDALGDMLLGCPAPTATGAPTTAAGPSPAPAPTEATPSPAPTVAPTTAASGSVYYANCAAARAAGAAPIRRGEPGYRDGLDGDQDGIACE